MASSSNNFKGVFLATAAAALFGISTPLAKLLQLEVQPIMLASLFYLGTGIGFALLATGSLLKTKQSNTMLLRRADLPALALVVCAGGIFAPACLMLGLSHCSASSASLLLNIEGVFTALIAWIYFHENCDRKIILGMLAITAGGAMLSYNPTSGVFFAPKLNDLSGQILILLACLGWAVDNNFTRQIAAADAKQIAMIKGLVAGSCNLALALSLNQHVPSFYAIAAAMLVGFIGYGLSLVLYVTALRELGSARTSAYFATAPFLGALVSLFVFHESLTLQLGLAAIFMGAGVYLHLSEKHEHWHEHDELEHEHEHVHDIHHDHDHEPDHKNNSEEKPIFQKDGSEIAHTHKHQHKALSHSHIHYPDLHHRHRH
ncbi:DMT family transporter [soil metagenome]